MARVTFRFADSPDDPIYDGRVVISSHNWRSLKIKPTGKAAPEERYPDLQNLPVDPMEVANETLRKKFMD